MIPLAGLGWDELCYLQTWTAAVTATRGSQALLAVHGWLVAIAGPDRGAYWGAEVVICSVLGCRRLAQDLGAGGSVLPTASCSCSRPGGPFPTLSHGSTDLIVVWAVCRLLHRRVLLVIAHLHTHHRVHVQAHQLPSLNHCDADLQEGEKEYMGRCSHPRV